MKGVNQRLHELEIRVKQLEAQADISQDAETLLKNAKEVIKSYDEVSASFLQRRLSIGYSRAARLLDILEDEGIIGEADGSKPREVLKK